TQKADLPTARSGISACVVDGKIYAIGGTTEQWETVSYRHVEVYDPATNTWARKADLPTGRWGLFADVVDGQIYAIGGRAGSYSSSKNETYNPETDTWTTKSPMQQARTGLAGCVIENKIYVTGGHQGPPIVIQTSLEQYEPVVSEVNAEVSSRPQRFALYQNYPNPFNPQTTIHFEIPKSSEISIIIYNVKGELIESLFKGKKDAGNHFITWDAKDNPSGIYLIRLQADNYIQVKKCLLMK
ncbi:MAG: T9SS type A sorting domain-containing protein, partial [bacterium]|nr:T9SS type A sorting domain-containing protein [bacterium]